MAKLTLEERVARWVAKVQPDIAYCPLDQPYDKEDDDLLWLQGDRITLDDLLSDRGVPEDLRDGVVEDLVCRNCGAANLERYGDVGTQTAEEIAYDRRWRKWETRYADRVADFGKHLERYPYLGLKHPIGRAIARTIVAFPRVELTPATWWRARPAEGTRVFVEADMLPPGEADARSEGRFNHYGQRVFYLAADERAALAEISGGASSGLGWVQRFSLPLQQNILDLTRPELWRESGVPLLALGLVSTLRNLVPLYSSAWKPEYFIPRFIADCARESGAHGIVFESPHHFHKNLVLFEWDDRAVKFDGRPEAKQWNPRRLTEDTIDF